MRAVALLFALTFGASAAPGWRQVLEDRLSLFGNRNWIVITDSAYPLRSLPGIETVLSHESQIETIRHVLFTLSKDVRVRPVVYLNTELSYVPEDDAIGITAFRQLLDGILVKFPVLALQPQTIPHEDIMRTLDQAGQNFNVLIIRTNSLLPYSSVFIELRTAYWGDAQEQRLRQSIK